MVVIELQHISKRFMPAGPYAVHDVSLSIDKGQTLAILGGSGSGKTTLLKMINRLIDPCDGVVMIDGQDHQQMDLLQLRRSIGYVFQKISLFPHMTVEENLRLVLQLSELHRDQWPDRIRELLTWMNLSPQFLQRMPSELSGGQQQRVDIARALACHGHCLLMDEPFSALDPVNRQSIQQELRSIQQQLNLTVIFVTHDVLEAFRLGDRIAVMNHGLLQQIDSPRRILQHPATDFVAQLLQQTASHIEHFRHETDRL